MWDATRVAIDIDLDQPVILGVSVSVHVCATCSRMFRAQPPFLRPRCIYTCRVVQKAIDEVYRDGLAARCVPDRLARDFWVKPSEKMVRLWCRAFADEVDFTADYQPWVVANLSGVLCVDEVYQGELALLLAVDPAAPDGDRLVGYMLLSNVKAVDQDAIKAFLDQLRAAGVQPDEVITDDSRLYPSALAEIWPMAVHQLCLFHATRRVVRAVSDVIKQIRRSIPVPPPASLPSLLGRFRDTPPPADQHDADSERYRWRLARRTLGIAQAHALHQHISSARAIGRQLGVNHGTIREWLKLPPPDPAIVAELAAAANLMPGIEPPPPPWRDWDEARRVREDLRLYHTLFLHQTENLSSEEKLIPKKKSRGSLMVVKIASRNAHGERQRHRVARRGPSGGVPRTLRRNISADDANRVLATEELRQAFTAHPELGAGNYGDARSMTALELRAAPRPSRPISPWPAPRPGFAPGT